MDVEVRQSGSRLAVSAGARVLVRVPEPATTGYAWSVEELTGPLELEASELACSPVPTLMDSATRVPR